MSDAEAATRPAITPVILRAMVLAAGRGDRMRPLTDTTPKPMIPVQKRPMIDLVLDRLATSGVEDAVVNLHHLGGIIEAHLKTRSRPRVVFSPEDSLLDTGGGVRRALDHFQGAPFFAVNGDVVWLDGRTPALERLAAAWEDARMDVLLLLHPTTFALGYEGMGDFMMAPNGRLRRRREREVAPFVFAGVQILHPRLFEDTPEDAFSLNLLYDRAAESDRLWGLRHDGEWFHIGTPESLKEAESALHHLHIHAVQR